MKVSVILCTHNPDATRLRLTLQALVAQTLPPAEWETVLVDNASVPAIDAGALATFAPANLRVVVAPQPGLTPARLRGIAAARADIVLFVDDDNVLAANYLSVTLAVAQAHPYLGVWGGQLIPRFEQPPAAWTEPYWPLLALRTLDRDRWSNLPEFSWCPWGAGLTVRASVARAYAEHCSVSALSRTLGRRPGTLGGSEDLDLALTACELRLGYGLFRALRLEHLIPPRRLEETYLLCLRESSAHTDEQLRLARGLVQPASPPTWRDRLHDLLASAGQPARARRFARAEQRGRALAHAMCRSAAPSTP